ncbi:MAG TPA: MFS transporter [Actinomycetota bacterium]|nr:MFS transporter [Actinomycetota bacterium]
MLALWRLLVRQGGLRLLLSAGLISLVGDWILRIGLAYEVYALTGSTVASAAMLLASLLPQILLGSVAGVFADRWDRRATMVVTNLLLAAGLLPLLLVQDARRVWIVYPVAVVQSCLAQFFVAAEASLLPDLVPRPDLVTANALNSQIRDIARLVGAACGGVIAALGGIRLLGLADAATFCLAASLLALIRLPRSRTARRDDSERGERVRSVWRDWVDGARLAWRVHTLRVLLVFVAITSVGEGVMGTLMAPFVRDVLQGNSSAFGLIMSMQAVGGILGGLVAASVGHRFRPSRLLAWGAVAFGAIDLALFLYPLAAPTLWPAFLLIVLVGPAGALMGAGLMTLFQTATAAGYRGRAFGALIAVEGVATLSGTLAAGLLGGRVGIVMVLTTQGAGYVLAGLMVLRSSTDADAPADHDQLVRAAAD